MEANVKIGSLPAFKVTALFGGSPDFGYPLGAPGKKNITALAETVKATSDKHRAKVNEIVGKHGTSSDNQKGDIEKALTVIVKDKKQETAAGARQKAMASLAATAKKRRLSI